ncbi:BgTH12-05628 [Blumeria graminis f. sp. triticale]|uniref:BgTH12-05628 n=1 Tax=Blumeria graminis f. sp. triticale TaxID=1689686 RepID=A0A9W4D4D9_BLUGR|nr:BgTH12-05628 [Blumeria graminis f. sp. triticale]
MDQLFRGGQLVYGAATMGRVLRLASR